MNNNHLWMKAQNVKIKKTEEIKTGFNVGFDEKIPEETKTELRKFIFGLKKILMFQLHCG